MFLYMQASIPLCLSTQIHAELSERHRHQSWGLIVIVISKFLKRYSKAKRTRAQAYSQALNKLVLVPLRVVTPSDFGMGGRGGVAGST